MGWKPSPLNVTSINYDKSSVPWSLTINGTGFDQLSAQDVLFVVQSMTTASFVKILMASNDDPSSGLVRATDLQVISPYLMTCSVDMSNAMKGTYDIVVDQTDDGFEVTVHTDVSNLKVL